MTETMTKKWNRAPLAPERVEEMERYLNKMSHEGWQCCEIVRGIAALAALGCCFFSFLLDRYCQ